MKDDDMKLAYEDGYYIISCIRCTDLTAFFPKAFMSNEIDFDNLFSEVICYPCFKAMQADREREIRRRKEREGLAYDLASEVNDKQEIKELIEILQAKQSNLKD